MGRDDLQHFLLQLRHRGEGNILGCFGCAHQNTGILLREKPFRHKTVKVDGCSHGEEKEEEHEYLVTQHPSEHSLITAKQPIETTLGRPIKYAWPSITGFRPKKARAHHRR